MTEDRLPDIVQRLADETYDVQVSHAFQPHERIAEPASKKDECDRGDALCPPVIGAVFRATEAEYPTEWSPQAHGAAHQNAAVTATENAMTNQAERSAWRLSKPHPVSQTRCLTPFAA